MPTPEEAFGQVLRELRDRRGTTQQELAFEADLDRTFVSLLERGLRQPSLSTILRLAAALHIKPSRVISLVEDRLA